MAKAKSVALKLPFYQKGMLPIMQGNMMGNTMRSIRANLMKEKALNSLLEKDLQEFGLGIKKEMVDKSFN
ncbi:hypothetical protein [Desulfobacula sp.]|uniref:hypothetical protein n=1 Tax=Desulfobacula sp. TaxID=2593537 RepID=UPI0026145DA6|nr:hypothetical protein [Desulfobacula sp.]